MVIKGVVVLVVIVVMMILIIMAIGDDSIGSIGDGLMVLFLKMMMIEIIVKRSGVKVVWLWSRALVVSKGCFPVIRFLHVRVRTYSSK